ncbi:MAG: type II toxin-antitoxin system HicA family toxin [Bryobacteraceae bacterium]
MTASELKRKLKALGCTFENATGHTRVVFEGRISFIPRHDNKEIRTGTLKAILKQLGIKNLQ